MLVNTTMLFSAEIVGSFIKNQSLTYLIHNNVKSVFKNDELLKLPIN